MLITHLSDLHFCREGVLYQRVLDTQPRFSQALDLAASFTPDLLILSGDVTEHGDAESYGRARDF